MEMGPGKSLLEEQAMVIPVLIEPVNNNDKAALVNGAGLYREDDPIVQEWLKIMDDNRRKLDEEEGIER
jgi:hypothetical protein